jgi:hypothetical protein
VHFVVLVILKKNIKLKSWNYYTISSQSKIIHHNRTTQHKITLNSVNGLSFKAIFLHTFRIDGIHTTVIIISKI